ncbi:phosphoesterase [Vibrio phage vB_VpaP_G1]|uniref:Phosphoesterase n=1 Tax=Vibrio phage vB_VpaP_G1 TaxID=2862773 RepID=A0AAE7WVC5_9CAUD|nr:metallo-phosphoesterase [Vibrio phage vB_VpaP_G1]QYW05836.1 phosphoesterase [Vibrio phage vB_VpaP_G1]
MPKINAIHLFTKDTHTSILKQFSSNVMAAAAYNMALAYGAIPTTAQVKALLEDTDPEVDEVVYRQMVRYWRTIFIENAGKKSKANNGMKEARKLITPSATDDIGDTFIPEMSRRLMVIGDLHAPYTHPDAMAFLKKVRDEYGPDMVVQVGDETDGHAISFHDSDPNLDSAGVELEKAKVTLETLHELFPNLLICDSNHGSLVYRRAKAHGLPVQFIKKYRDILFPEHGAPGWSWADAWVINTPLGAVRFQHQVSGDFMLQAAHERTSLVLGHEHGRFEVQYAASSNALYFGAYAGCLIDRKSMAFAYGKLTRKKPILGCMVITDGNPQLIPMLLDEEGRWVDR